ncbi:MAG: amidase [Parvularculaceae bacterium]
MAGVCGPSRRQTLAGLGSIAIAACANRHFETDDLTLLGIKELSDGFSARRFSPVDAVDACFARINRFDGIINAFITLDQDGAREAAARALSEISAGQKRGLLHGVPIAIKDNIDVAGFPRTAASNAYTDYWPAADAEVVRRLKAAGAIILGKLNMHEVAFGATGAVSNVGPARNPWNPDRITGGSSSGAAAAVAAGFCYAAVGTDTGGSIRIPASMCGVFGLKPTYGRISADGVMPLSETYDHIGPICRSTSDISIMFDIMAGNSAPEAGEPVNSLRLGALSRPLDYCDAVFSAEIREAFDVALRVLRGGGAEIVNAALPVPDFDRIIEAEAYRYHAGAIGAEPKKFDPRTLASLMGGAEVPDIELDMARKALADRRMEAAALFHDFDLVLIPTVLRTPPTIDEADDPFDLTDACTFIFNQLGLPALTLPFGVFPDGMPMGLTIGGPPGSETRILSVADLFERRTAWNRRPVL